MDVMRPIMEISPRKVLLSSKTFPVESSPRKGEGESFNEDKNKESHCYDSDTNDPYASDNFRMFEFKIRRCTRSRSHDWTDCPFAHPGEKARRRDPRRFKYSGEICPEFRRNGDCSREDDCECAHGVFECWLHPIRYRTEACKDGKRCKRKVCFFAHSPRQLRFLPPENISGGSESETVASPMKNNPCCLFCSSSPTTTLLSQLSRSPPLSPAEKVAAFSRLRNRAASAVSAAGSVNYKDVLSNLVSSLDSMRLAEALQVSYSSPVSSTAFASPCVLSNQHSSPLQFAMSPSTPSYLNSPRASFFSNDFTPRRRQMTTDFTPVSAVRDKVGFEDVSNSDPDLGWVNDLLT